MEDIRVVNGTSHSVILMGRGVLLVFLLSVIEDTIIL